MCGIAGLVVPPGRRVDEGMLRRLTGTLGHRGPDDEGIAILTDSGLPHVGLAHTRLSILDPRPAGHQPMSTTGGRWWLAYNGEIFNHRELREKLPATRWQSATDTETLLRLLERFGPGILPQCNGFFGFAAVDTARRQLHLARDRWGIKPLYYARLRGGFAFASELKALLEAGVAGEPEPGVLEQALAGWANGHRTPIRGIFRLLPGDVLTVDLDRLSLRTTTWFRPEQLVDATRASALSGCSRDEVDQAVERELRQAVRRRLLADVPVGTMCSGGVDSSLVTALAAQEQPVCAYTAAVVDQPEMDEAPWARRVAQHLGVELRVVDMTSADWRRHLVPTVAHVEYPLTHESSVPMFLIAERARADGVKVLLSGEGADELFGGYEYLHRKAYNDFSRRGHVAESAARTLLRTAQRRGWRANPDPDPRPALDADVGAYEADVVARARRAYRHHPGARRRLEAALLADLSLYLPHLLNRQDKTTMMASVETRVPFLDPDFAALAVNLPLESRIAPERKAPLRRLVRRLLPSEVADRPKVGFGFDVAACLGGAARTDFLAGGLLREALGRPKSAWAAGVAGLSGHGVLLAWTAEIWCRLMLGGDGVDDVEGALWAAG